MKKLIVKKKQKDTTYAKLLNKRKKEVDIEDVDVNSVHIKYDQLKLRTKKALQYF